MITEGIPHVIAVVIGFTAFAIMVLAAFALAYAKRDVTIDITLFELRR